MKALKKFTDCYEKVTNEEEQKDLLEEVKKSLIGLMNEEIQFE